MAGEGGECVKITGYRIGKRMKVALIGDAEEIASFLKQMEGDNGEACHAFAKETAEQIYAIYSSFYRDWNRITPMHGNKTKGGSA